jgi:peroxiredoxin
MSRFSKILFFAAAAMAAVSCGSNARIEGELSDAPSSEVVVKLLNVNHYEVLDTVKTNASGKFSYKVDVKKGQPEFVYVFYKDTKIASLLLEAGDAVSVEADTLGNFTVSGSEESLKLAQVDKEYAEALVKINAIASKFAGASAAEQAALRQQLGKEYIDYYRSSVRYVMENSHSLTVVPVFFQNFGADLPVFSQNTDALHFSNVSDSLATVYPESKYLKALKAEADRRRSYLELESRILNAREIGYPNITLPDVNGEKVTLSEIDSKVIMVYFWSASDVNQKMFNLDVLKSLYDEFHSKGFEIFQVSLDQDKALWAKVVKQQNLPWVNVCDSRGAASPYVSLYNLPALPAVFIINDGQLVDGSMVDEKSFRNMLRKLM